MATVRGFKSVRYNPEKIEDFGNVLAPPYDVINSKEQDELYAKDPNNVIRLILSRGEGDVKYEGASATFQHWLSEGILLQDKEPSIYPYYQEFEWEGKKLTRRGFIAAVKLEDFSTKVILPHERTFQEHKRDRLKLITACNANMSPIFCVYSDPEGAIEQAISEKTKEAPIFNVSIQDGVRNKLWKISDPEILSLISARMPDKSLLIADGHHRYETALEYRDMQMKNNGAGSCENKPYEYVMTFLSRGEDEGLIINPTHRVVKSLSSLDRESFLEHLGKDFELAKLPLNEGISNIGYGQFAIVTKDRKFAYRASLKNATHDSSDNLGVTLLHNKVLSEIIEEEEAGILYTKSISEALELVQYGKYELGFILPELRASDIFKVVASGRRMPHKTTYFYPKILSGLVFNPLW